MSKQLQCHWCNNHTKGKFIIVNNKLWCSNDSFIKVSCIQRYLTNEKMKLGKYKCTMCNKEFKVKECINKSGRCSICEFKLFNMGGL